MQQLETTTPTALSSQDVCSECPQCQGELAILRVFGGRTGAEYWTQRCVNCGGIHLDIVRPIAAAVG
jgi:uncharacterized Zn finger protein